MSYRFRFQKDVSYELLKSFDFLEQTPLLNCKAPEAGCDSIEKLDIDEYLKAVSELEKNMQEHIEEERQQTHPHEALPVPYIHSYGKQY